MQDFGLNPSACTVDVCWVCVLPPSLHSTPFARVLPSPQSAVCIFRSVPSLYSLHKENRLVLLLITQQTPRPRDPVLSTDPVAPAPCTPHLTPHPGPVLSTKPDLNRMRMRCVVSALRLLLKKSSAEQILSLSRNAML